MPTEWLPVPLPSTLQLDQLGEQVGSKIEITRHADGWLHVVGTGKENESAASRLGTLVEGTSIIASAPKGVKVRVDGYWELSRQSVNCAAPHVSGRAASATYSMAEGAPATITEWLENVHDKWHWPHRTRREQRAVRHRETSRPSENWNETESVSCDHVYLELNRPDLKAVTFGVVAHAEAPEIYRPGFLEFERGEETLPDERLRRTVRRALEFLFGGGLGVHGWSEATADGLITSTTLTTCHVPGGRGREPPPALFHTNERNSVDASLVQDFLVKYVSAACSLGLNEVVWHLANARSSTLDMTAGYIGAAFEALRRRYYEADERARRTKWLPGPRWKELECEFTRVLKEQKTRDEWGGLSEGLEAIRCRLGSLNSISSKVANERFLTDLGLEFGDVERNALQARNDAAHANPISPGEEARTLGRCRALYTLVARALLAAIGADLKYFDYSPLDYPVLELNQPMGGTRVC